MTTTAASAAAAVAATVTATATALSTATLFAMYHATLSFRLCDLFLLLMNGLNAGKMWARASGWVSGRVVTKDTAPFIFETR